MELKDAKPLYAGHIMQANNWITSLILFYTITNIYTEVSNLKQEINY